MREEVLEMTTKELNRLKILSLVNQGKLTQVLAAKQLDISERHIRRLLKNLKTKGDRSIISIKRGKSSNRAYTQEFKSSVLGMVERYYADFGPKLAQEFLQAKHDIKVSIETLRIWMIKSHLWVPRTKKNKKKHPPRERRACFGELIQVDGSHHAWFEDRAPPCVLMVFVDDATSAITSMHFAEGESLEAYYCTLKKHIEAYGIPLSLYGDKCAVLSPRNQAEKRESTQFQKALKELDCQLILALSPQAKGKVERSNRTLQDRLVKELRLRGISTIEDANEFLDEYRQRYNEIFSKKPREQCDAHRPLEGVCLENVLSIRETRTLTKDSVMQFKNTFYQISEQEEKVSLFKGCKVEIRQLLNGKTIALVKGKEVKMKPLKEIESPLVDEKQFLEWKTKHLYIPPKTHPYKLNYGKNQESRCQAAV